MDLQNYWASFVDEYEPILGGPLFSPTMGSMMFLSLSTLCLILDETRVADKWKIQKNKYTTRKDVIKVLLSWTFTQFIFMVIPTSIAIYNGVFTPIPRTLPSFKEFVSGIAVSFLIFDGLYFFWHWAHHKVPFLYRKFHAVHHEVRVDLAKERIRTNSRMQYNAPFSFVAQYLNIGETLVSGVFAAVGPAIMGPMHPLTMWIFMIILISASVEDHCGYDFPFSLSNWSFGLYGGPKAHDRHHVAFYGNYAPFFSFWDKIFGTEIPLKADKMRSE